MIGWEKLWRSPEVRKRWEKMPPLPEVREMADLLEASGRRRLLDIGTDLDSLEGEFDGAAAVMVIHHARRATLEGILAQITEKLAPAGLFVWETATPKHFHCGRGEEIEPGTWVDPNHPEGPVPHHYSTEEEVRELLGEYDMLSLHEHEFREGSDSRFHWRVLARKRSDP